MEEFKRNMEETNVIRAEKASAMEAKYQQSTDPWKNGQRNLYIPMMDQLISKLLEAVGYLPDYVTWVDIGCGGGYVGRGISDALKSRDIEFEMYGCDISPTAIKYLEEDPTSPYAAVQCMDIEKLSLDEAIESFHGSDMVISMVEVMYYLGEKKPWKETIDTLWEALKPGTIVVIADGLISYQYREYLGRSKEDAELIVSYTDMETPVCREVSDNGKEWNRHLKVRIYRKK